jgi:hypothetical protein
MLPRRNVTHLVAPLENYTNTALQPPRKAVDAQFLRNIEKELNIIQLTQMTIFCKGVHSEEDLLTIEMTNNMATVMNMAKSGVQP